MTGLGLGPKAVGRVVGVAAELGVDPGVDPGADAEAVRAAYRERVKEVHPDTEGGDEAEVRYIGRPEAATPATGATFSP